MRRFQKLPPHLRRVVFFSEGPSGWAHLGPIAREFIANKQTICWVSSRKDDPGLAIEDPHFVRFYVGSSSVRIFTFAALDCGVLITTTPDLNNNEIKRSRFNPLYVYVHHSLASHHMIYRPRAFAAFDAILCAGQYHMDELAAEEAVYKLPARKKIAHGYGRLDTLIQQQNAATPPNAAPHVLIAPSWGEHCLIEAGYTDPLIASLLSQNFQVTLRPHPRTFEHAPDTIHALRKKYPALLIDDKIASDHSMLAADIMVSDWSGAAMEYAFSRCRPVLFIDTPRKINNPEYTKIPCEPLEVSIRDKIGVIIPANALANAADTVSNMLASQAEWSEKIKNLREKTIFNISSSAKAAHAAILNLLAERGT